MYCPVSWGCRIHWLLLCRGVGLLPQTSVLDMTLNNLMVRFQWYWGFGECGALCILHFEAPQVPSDKRNLRSRYYLVEKLPANQLTFLAFTLGDILENRRWWLNSRYSSKESISMIEKDTHNMADPSPLCLTVREMEWELFLPPDQTKLNLLLSKNKTLIEPHISGVSLTNVV